MGSQKAPGGNANPHGNHGAFSPDTRRHHDVSPSRVPPDLEPEHAVRARDDGDLPDWLEMSAALRQSLILCAARGAPA